MPARGTSCSGEDRVLQDETESHAWAGRGDPPRGVRELRAALRPVPGSLLRQRPAARGSSPPDDNAPKSSAILLHPHPPVSLFIPRI